MPKIIIIIDQLVVSTLDSGVCTTIATGVK